MISGCPLKLPPWPSPYGEACFLGTLKACPEDFEVEELIDLEPTGQGEYDLLKVRKRGRNTVDVAKELARFAHVPYAAVSYAGLKDRQAVTTQLYSVHLPGKTSPDWHLLDAAGVSTLQVGRHGRKLRRGAHRGNYFTLFVRRVEGDLDQVDERAKCLAERGFANYFGKQRFGRDGGNLEQAAQMLAGNTMPSRGLRSILLSAIRSFLFNEVLAQRVEAGDWDAWVEGDFMMLDGAQSIFDSAGETDLDRRLGDLEIHPTGPLPGRAGRDPVQQLTPREQACLARYQKWLNALAELKVKQSRRSLRTQVRGLEVEVMSNSASATYDIRLSFALDKGAYATTMLQQLGFKER